MKIHPKFKFNGKSFSDKTLNEFAHHLIKEGQSFEADIGTFILNWLNPSKKIVVSTSGSTGNPKQIELKKEYMVNSAMATGDFFKIKPSNTALLCLPSIYIAGKMMLVRAMILGLEIDVTEPNSNPLDGVSKSYDFVAMIPLQAQNSIRQLHQIKQLIVGGAPITLSLENKLELISSEVYATYGMTETITHVAIRKVGKTTFKALPKISFKTDDRGCLVIDAPLVSDDRVITNDLVELISANEFKWLGRFDSIINSGGIKLIPEQIELKLNKIMDNQFFVAGIPDDTLGEKLVLLVEGEEDSLIFEKVRNFKELSKYEVPKQVYFLNNFVETATGKINRKKTLTLLKR
jgi:O-succinylbenzoic acid--CoA ligase